MSCRRYEARVKQRDDGNDPDIKRTDTLRQVQTPGKFTADHKQTAFADNPASSPTGFPVAVSASIDAAVYVISTPNYSGYVVGLLATYEFSSGNQTGEIVLFAPGAVAASKADAATMMKSLAEGDPALASPVPPVPPAVPSCEDACKNTLIKDLQTATDTYLTNCKIYCAVLAPLPSFGAECAVGTLICGWWIPPASTIVCCVAGGIIGTGVGVGGCIYAQHELYKLQQRTAQRDYRNCMLNNCGVTVVEH